MKKRYFAAGISVILLAVIDQIIKYFVVKNMEFGVYKPVIGDILGLEYIQNTGSAWGMLSKYTFILTILSIVILLAVIYAYKNVSCSDRYRIIRILMVFVAGGAIGNLIDRIRLKYVVDYIYVKCINFPVFNFADICVTVSMILLILLIIFKFNGKDFDVILGEASFSESGEYVYKHPEKAEISETDDKNDTDNESDSDE